MSKELTEFESVPYFLLVYAFNSQLTKQKSVPRLNKFFEFLGLNGTMQENCSTFARNAKERPSWALNSIIRYLQINKERVENKEIASATLHNSVKVIKLFCEMNEIGFTLEKDYERSSESEKICR